MGYPRFSREKRQACLFSCVVWLLRRRNKFGAVVEKGHSETPVDINFHLRASIVVDILKAACHRDLIRIWCIDGRTAIDNGMRDVAPWKLDHNRVTLPVLKNEV